MFANAMMSRLFVAIGSLLFSVALSLAAPLLVSADQARYIYDDLGRLVQVIDGQGNVATYTYDAVVSLLSSARSTRGADARTITGFTGQC